MNIIRASYLGGNHIKRLLFLHIAEIYSRACHAENGKSNSLIDNINDIAGGILHPALWHIVVMGNININIIIYRDDSFKAIDWIVIQMFEYKYHLLRRTLI